MNKTAFVFLAAALVVHAAHAQSPSTSSFAGLVAVNTAIAGGGYTTLSSAYGDGSPISTSGSFSFTGMDRAGATQTMVFSGSAASSAEYGRLHGRSTARLVNSYYNAANPFYVDGNGGVANANGSPDDLSATTASFFDDTLQFGGALQSGYFARYIFHVDGTNSGPRSLAVLGVTIAGVNKTFGDGDTGPFVADWTTDDIPIDGTNPQSIHVQFDTLANFGTESLTGRKYGRRRLRLLLDRHPERDPSGRRERTTCLGRDVHVRFGDGLPGSRARDLRRDGPGHDGPRPAATSPLGSVLKGLTPSFYARRPRRIESWTRGRVFPAEAEALGYRNLVFGDRAWWLVVGGWWLVVGSRESVAP